MKQIALTLFCFFGCCISFASAQPNTLDPTFGNGGKVMTPMGAGSEIGYAVVVLPDGKILAAGRKHNGSNYDFLLIFYNANGTLAPFYGNNGKVISDFGRNETATSVAVQPDGKVLVGGTAYDTASYFMLARYQASGELDPTFGDGGQATATFENSAYAANAIALQPDGKILVVGEFGSTNTQVAMARFEADGTPDSSFGFFGWVRTDVKAEPGRDVAESIALQPDGRIVVAGWTRYNSGLAIDFLLLRYKSDGSLDSTFGVHGQVITGFGTNEDKGLDVVVQPDGKIVVVGNTLLSQSQGGFALARYLPNGDPDPGFGTSGTIVKAFEATSGANSVVLQPDGKIVAGGVVYASSNSNPAFSAARFSPDGTLDTLFGTEGLAIADFGSYAAISGALALQADGKIVQAGMYAPANFGTAGVALSRYLSSPILGMADFSTAVKDMLVYPNPLQEKAMLQYTLAQEETLTLGLYDGSGKLVKTFFSGQKRSRGEHRESLKMEDYSAPGTYFLVLRNGFGQISLPITKL